MNSHNELLVNPSSHNTKASNETKNNDKTNELAIHPQNTNKSDVPLTFAEVLERVSGPSPHSTGGTEANEIAEATGINQSDPTCTDGTTMSGPSPHSTGGTEVNEKAEATGINQSDPTCTNGTNMPEPSINSGMPETSINSGTGTNNNNLGKNKPDKLNISESVRGIKNKKRKGQITTLKIRNQARVTLV